MLHADVSVVIAAPLSCLSHVLFYPFHIFFSLSFFLFFFFFLILTIDRLTKIELGDRIGGEGRRRKKNGQYLPYRIFLTHSQQSSSIFHTRSNPQKMLVDRSRNDKLEIKRGRQIEEKRRISEIKKKKKKLQRIESREDSLAAARATMNK